VTNQLAVDTSIHWHGILLPYQMDGVPGIGFKGIAPYWFEIDAMAYIGLEWAKQFGQTADFSRTAGEDTSETRWVAGLRFWF